MTLAHCQKRNIPLYSLETSHNNLNPTSPLEIDKFLVYFQVFCTTVNNWHTDQSTYISNLRCWIGAHTTLWLQCTKIFFSSSFLQHTVEWWISSRTKLMLSCFYSTKIFTSKIPWNCTTLSFEAVVGGEEFWLIISQWIDYLDF